MAGTDELKNMVMAFRVSDLQTLLAFAQRNKVGRKYELQARVLDLLKLKSTPIQMKIRELYKNMGHSAGSQPPQYNPSVPPSSGYQTHQQAPNWLQNMQMGMYPYYTSKPQDRLPIHPDVRLKPLPFYDHLSELLRPSTLMAVGSAEMQEQPFVFYLTPAQANDLAFNREGSGGSSDYVIQVQMRFCLLETSSEQDDCFPINLSVTVNEKTCPLPPLIPTNKMNADQKRPPRPVNITNSVRLSPTIANTLQVKWAKRSQDYVVAVNLVRKLTSDQLLLRLKEKRARPAEYTTGQIKEKLREDADSEVATTSLRVSLRCPLGQLRMRVPCRPTTCTHLQCFDAITYLRMNEKKPTWTCPVCNQPGLFNTLVIDGYFQEVLASDRLLPDVNEIELQSDGSWSISSSETKDKNETAAEPVVKSRGGPPPVLATVEIDDDDVVPVGSDSEASNPGSAKPRTGPPAVAANISTVDLTTSDDEDVVPTPMKIGNQVSAVAGSSVNNTFPYLSFNSNYCDVISLDSPSPPSTPQDTLDPLLI